MKRDFFAIGYFVVAVVAAVEGAWDRRENRRLQAERDARDRRIADLEARVRELEAVDRQHAKEATG